MLRLKRYQFKRKNTLTNLITGAHEFERSMMLQLTVNIINPTTCVGISNYKMEIQNATLQKFSNNVQEVVDFIEANYEEIVAHNCTHHEYTMHLLTLYQHLKTKFFVL